MSGPRGMRMTQAESFLRFIEIEGVGVDKEMERDKTQAREKPNDIIWVFRSSQP